MAYDKSELESLALAAISTYNLIRQNEVIAYLPCSEATFYNLELGEIESIKNALFQNRVKGKNKLRRNWEKGDAPPILQIAAFKLMADDDELTRLNSQKIEAEHTLKGSGLKIGFADDNDGK